MVVKTCSPDMAWYGSVYVSANFLKYNKIVAEENRVKKPEKIKREQNENIMSFGDILQNCWIRVSLGKTLVARKCELSIDNSQFLSYIETNGIK